MEPKISLFAAQLEVCLQLHTFPKTNMDTLNDALEKVTGPFNNRIFWYLC